MRGSVTSDQAFIGKSSRLSASGGRLPPHICLIHVGVPTSTVHEYTAIIAITMPDGTSSSYNMVDPDILRRDFCSALSAMYRQEVPLYGDLIELVDDVNEAVKSRGGSWETSGERCSGLI